MRLVIIPKDDDDDDALKEHNKAPKEESVDSFSILADHHHRRRATSDFGQNLSTCHGAGSGTPAHTLTSVCPPQSQIGYRF